jgi:hypothetical protein
MGDEEINLDFDGSFVFQDLETSASVRVDTALLREQYVKRVSDWMSKSRLTLYEKQINYQLILLSDPFEKSLRNFLRVRKSISR